jgi:hypothetical protein
VVEQVSRLLATTVVALVAVVALAAAAGAAPRDPLKLVLQRTDVPGAKLVETARGPKSIEDGLRRMGISARAAHFSYVDVRTAGLRLNFAGVVIAMGGAAQARKAFAFLKRESLRIAAGRATTVSLRRFGDEQLATYTTNAGPDLLVRRSAVVWSLSVRETGAGGLSWERSRSPLLTVAAKQQRRVGAG